MTPPTSYRYADGYNRCVGGVMTPPYIGAEHQSNQHDKLEFEASSPGREPGAVLFNCRL